MFEKLSEYNRGVEEESQVKITSWWRPDQAAKLEDIYQKFSRRPDAGQEAYKALLRLSEPAREPVVVEQPSVEQKFFKDVSLTDSQNRTLKTKERNLEKREGPMDYLTQNDFGVGNV